MAKPQKENGYTPIANEILDQIVLYPFNASQLKIILKIWRMTYGYKRKDHDLSQTFLRDTTGLSESTVKREIAALIKSNVLYVTKEPTKTESRRLAFNKDYDSWIFTKSGEVVPKQLDLFSLEEGSDSTPHESEGGGFRFDPSEGSDLTPQNDDRRVQIRPLYKESNSLKKSIKEKESMFEQFYQIYPRKASKKKAESSWRTLCKDKDFDPDKAILQTMNFVDTCKLLKTETKYIPYPATFLNQKRFEEYEVIDPEGLAKNKKSNQKSSKVNDNMDFFLQGFGGGVIDQGRIEGSSRESIITLPESST